MSESLSAEHARIGRIVADWITHYARDIETLPVAAPVTPAELEKLFDEPAPRDGMSAEEVLMAFARDIAPHSTAISSPRYFGQFNPTPLPVAVWADALCSALNQNGAAWRNSSAASVLEARVLKWLCALIGYEPESFGTLTSGGSEANLVALKIARDRAHGEIKTKGIRAAAGDLIVYVSDQAHYSFIKSVDILGLGRENLRVIATDENFHIKLEELRATIIADKAQGKIPCCIAGAAGATSTGAIDDLNALAEMAREFDCWFHVDAAYGGAMLFSKLHGEKLCGIARADSVTLDPHKWMFVPFACGATLVHDGAQVLRDAFDWTPEYLNETREHLNGTDAQYDFFRYGQLGTRRFNALKLWMAWKTLGARGYAKIIERQLALVEYLAEQLEADENFVRLGRVETAVCCFKYLPESLRAADSKSQDRVQQNIQQRIERSGAAYFATTVLHGRRALRINVNSFLTEQRHIEDLIESVRRAGAEVWQEMK